MQIQPTQKALWLFATLCSGQSPKIDHENLKPGRTKITDCNKTLYF
jgi:hypothetical protein